VRCFHRGAQSVVTRVECLSIRYLVVKEPVGIVPRGVAGGTGKVRILFERTGGGILGFVRLDYEPGMAVKYFAGRWTFSFSPTCALPVHPEALSIHSVYSTGAITDRTRVEKLENSFFWTLGVVYRL